ncbi:hypothetical protein [Gelidibacter salicanalis]|uniref:Uncharacterized protein n=1 Tax=Gelidibacter salicanalis TaxID=291193 RepID=A0A934KVT6_9FLAO|nr:hypothetical protein [Gelidibacter salicanalis]MBJ7881198.1 hypothetical protein [Gelidibacter salicanalis]
MKHLIIIIVVFVTGLASAQHNPNRSILEAVKLSKDNLKSDGEQIFEFISDSDFNNRELELRNNRCSVL